jgi:hypothetical protein
MVQWRGPGRASGRFARPRQIGRYVLAELIWQSVFDRLAGYADVNGAERLRHDAATHRTRGFDTLGARIS